MKWWTFHTLIQSSTILPKPLKYFKKHKFEIWLIPKVTQKSNKPSNLILLSKNFKKFEKAKISKQDTWLY
jgi:hypothetical protein